MVKQARPTEQSKEMCMRPACCLAKSESEDILPGAQGTGARGPAAQIPPWAWLKDCMSTFIL